MPTLKTVTFSKDEIHLLLRKEAAKIAKKNGWKAKHPTTCQFTIGFTDNDGKPYFKEASVGLWEQPIGEPLK